MIGLFVGISVLFQEGPTLKAQFDLCFIDQFPVLFWQKVCSPLSANLASALRNRRAGFRLKSAVMALSSLLAVARVFSLSGRSSTVVLSLHHSTHICTKRLFPIYFPKIEHFFIFQTKRCLSMSVFISSIIS